MAKNKKASKYTVVYVYGPTRCKDSYYANNVLNRENGEFVKIGKTDYDGNLDDCTEESLKIQAINRCNQESKTGIPDWCDIYDTFIFPKISGNVDDIIRNLLCNDVYELENSKAEKGKGDIKPGKEFVYGVSRNHIKHSVEAYCFQQIIDSSPDTLEDIQKLCMINSIAITHVDDREDNEFQTTRKSRDINLILSPGDIVYLLDARNGSKPVEDSNSNQVVHAEYVGNKKFSYNNESPMSASRLALELIKKYKGITYDTISGYHCWAIEREEDGVKKYISLAQLCDQINNAQS